MAVASEPNIVRQGELSFKHKGQLIKKLKKHKARLFQHSECGVARLEIYESDKDQLQGSYCLLILGSDVVTVRELIKPNSSDEKNGFVIATKEQQHVFCTNRQDEQISWIKDVRNTFLHQHTSANKQLIKHKSKEVTEENDIYEPAEEFLKEYKVTPGYETRRKVGLDDKVRLVVENGHITIITLQGNRAGRWGIEHLRRFGYKDDEFHFEAGRKSEYGEGFFTFVTNQGKQIHTLVSKEKMKTRMSKDAETSRRPMLNPGQIQVSIDNDDDDDIPLSTGNHIYEEVPIRIRPTEKKAAPDKPARQTCVNSQQADSEHIYENARTNSPPALSQVSGKGSASSISLSQLPKVKSQPTGLALGQSKVHYQPASEALKTFPNNSNPTKPKNDIYSEPVHHKEAWKTHGMADSPSDECEYNIGDQKLPAPSTSNLVRDGASGDESLYATLDFTTKKNILQNHKRDHANRLVDDLISGGKMKIGETWIEPIYAVVNKPKKSPSAPEDEQSHL